MLTGFTQGVSNVRFAELSMDSWASQSEADETEVAVAFSTTVMFAWTGPGWSAVNVNGAE